MVFAKLKNAFGVLKEDDLYYYLYLKLSFCENEEISYTSSILVLTQLFCLVNKRNNFQYSK